MGIENFHLYVYGTHFALVTDHKPLETIYGNPRSKPSARIERWVLRLQPYSFKVEYRAGDENHADYMSRHPTDRSISTHSKISEEYVNFLTKHAVPRAMTLKEIIEATNADKTLNGLRAAIRLNRWDSDIVAPFRKVKDELTVTPENIILRGTRIVLPEALQQRAVDIAHESHQGLSKVKALLRTKTWFPGIDDLAKRTVDQCIPCQATGKPNNPEPLRMTDMPSGPWQKVHLDFYGPLPSGEHLLVCIDRYSRYPEVKIVRSTKAASVIPRLDKIFSVHGLPHQVISDNGPPFNSTEFARYMDTLGIQFDPTTPKWPQGNAEVERFMQPLGKAIQTAHAENKVWQQELYRFLLQYRSTPHSTTQVPPAELLFNRTVCGKLPILHPRKVINKHKQAQTKDKERREYNKQYADRKRHTKPSTIDVGDTVLVRQEKQNKLTTKFNQTPYTVINWKGSEVTARSRNNHIVRRNVSHCKKIPRPEQFDSDTDDDIQTQPRHINTGHRQPHEANVQVQPAQQQRRTGRIRRPTERFGHEIPSKFLSDFK